MSVTTPNFRRRSVALNTHLTNAELSVMDLLWNSKERLTARRIREALYPDASKSQHGTVQRLLQRLEEKGFVERDRELSIHFFSAAISRQNYAGLQLELLAEKLTAGSFTPLLTHLVDQRKISPAEIDQIRALLSEQESEENRP